MKRPLTVTALDLYELEIMLT
jgi:hypothetical protein